MQAFLIGDGRGHWSRLELPVTSQEQKLPRRAALRPARRTPCRASSFRSLRPRSRLSRAGGPGLGGGPEGPEGPGGPGVLPQPRGGSRAWALLTYQYSMMSEVRRSCRFCKKEAQRRCDRFRRQEARKRSQHLPLSLSLSFSPHHIHNLNFAPALLFPPRSCARRKGFIHSDLCCFGSRAILEERKARAITRLH